VLCDLRLVRLPDREPVLVRGSVTDITARKAMQQQLAGAEAERQLAARARDLHRVTEAGTTSRSGRCVACQPSSERSTEPGPMKRWIASV
jgi:hypothetical protein